MKFQTITTQQVVTDTEIETPAWFKISEFGQTIFYQINSEQDIISATVDSVFTKVSRCPLRFLHNSAEIFKGKRITQDEFRNALEEAEYKIKTGLQVLATS